ncbi:DNA mismatch repair protein MutS [Paenibacillus albiflavus]|uniref:DNA mismatch repair protein MutS n=1 Tax=Paenibacillus albiflavus TaxID=2545760 RepID=A0A4R4EMK0_9BACL|nr:DNA mismatch repair protein MutS [Paenibacillus albiflavus]TCZ81067.1 DNA mismatch repair protein MutS [Paenibacillus albiflavus]
MAQYTPMIQQYLAIKAQVPDALLFFRLGDFYEMFFDDALEASRELEITLTGREGGTEERIPMCGVPYHAAEGFLTRLVEKGYKVAICEQVEDPAAAKGIVRREIIRIVTPGTVMESKALGEATNNYMLSITQSVDGYGLTACDISTGELHVTLIVAGIEPMLDEINVYAPSEIIGSSELLAIIKERLPIVGKPIVYTTREHKNVDEQAQLLDNFPLEQVSSLRGATKESVMTLLMYLQETQKRSLSHFKHIHLYEQAQYMTMDPFTRRNLELTETVRERSKKGSLLWLIDGTVTAMGARLLRRWIDKPLLSKERIDERLEAVERLYGNLIARDEVRIALKEVYDLERLVARLSYGNANARDMVALKLSLSQVPLLKEACMNSGSATLQKLASQMDDCQDIKNWIEQAIVDEPPVSVRDGGMIRVGLDDYLDKLKEASMNGKKWIAELERKEREVTGIKSLKVGFNKVFGYYLEVTKSNIGSLPEGRYERKQTLANAERFITPELKEQETLILEAEDKMFDLEFELFSKLRNQICEHVSRLQGLAERIAAVDILQGFAHTSAANHYVRPDITDQYDMKIEHGRHPVVEAVIERKAFIANDTEMTRDVGRMLLITGPNMAGKSTYMRQVAILTIMGQIGCFVPANKAVIPLVDRIFTRIGAADDLIGGQSTFMVEMMDIQTMTAKATSRSLVIIDELGRGTSTGEGMAIAQAVIEHLHNHVGCKTLVSTHFHELAHLEQSLAYLNNYCMAVKESDAGVTFLRKLIRGAASTSYGIYCAELAGLPQSIIGRSYDLLHAFETRAGLLEAAAVAEGAEVAPVKDAIEPVVAETSAAKPIENGSKLEEAMSPPIVQLSLFDTGEEQKAKQQSGANEIINSKQHKVLEQLKAADLINMTPLQALNLIYDLKQKL